MGQQSRQVVQDRNDRGDSRVRYWLLDDSGLDFLGCDWHYSARDDRLIADHPRVMARRDLVDGSAVNLEPVTALVELQDHLIPDHGVIIADDAKLKLNAQGHAGLSTNSVW